MKRLILIMLAATLVLPASFAQSFTLSDDHGPITNGSTILVWGDLTNFMVSHIKVTNGSASAKNVKVVRTENSVITGSINYFCWDQCYDPSTDTSIGHVAIAAGATNSINFQGDYSAMGNPGTTNVTYTFFDASNPGDKVSFNVNYYGSPASIGENGLTGLNIGKAYPNPASSSFSFDYSVPRSAQDVRIVIRDILGNVVQDVALSAGNGTVTLSASEMKEGIYFYSIVEGNRTLSTRKLVIK